MINDKLFNPSSIAIIGASNDTGKPSGRLQKNLVESGYCGKIYPVNPKSDYIQGIKCCKIEDVPEHDLCFIAIPAKFVPDTVEFLACNKSVKSFIIVSAGFSELNESGRYLENSIISLASKYNATILGPNCTGLMSRTFRGTFTLPLPEYNKFGCDLISGSGATACFIMEQGIEKGLGFANVVSVGNSACIGVEDILEYLDLTYDSNYDSRIKLLYFESISSPKKLLKHAKSLGAKGCKLAGIKAGASDAGSRAASSHTGALSSSDKAVTALFRKAGIVRCYSREELISVASIFTYPDFKGRNAAIVTHAGGPGVILTDILSIGGINVPVIDGEKADDLLSKLKPGSSVSNPIDFLATGNAEDLSIILDYIDDYFDDIDACAVIFGTPGLKPIFDVYELLDRKISKLRKPVFPILTSGVTAREEINFFKNRGRAYFSDEYSFGNALSKVKSYEIKNCDCYKEVTIDIKKLTNISRELTESGYISQNLIADMLSAANLQVVDQALVDSEPDCLKQAEALGFPIVMKAVGPIHKRNVDGVRLDVNDIDAVKTNYRMLMAITGAQSVLIQKMVTGFELFAGVSREGRFGHLLFFGRGGTEIEVYDDVSSCLLPIDAGEADELIKSVKTYKLIQGFRNRPAVDKNQLVEILMKISKIIEIIPQISELDFNPIICSGKNIKIVDVRVKIN